MMWRAACFDFDGTLAHYEGDFDALLDGLRTDLGLLACDFATFKGRLAEATKRNGAVTLGSALSEALAVLELREPDDLEPVVALSVADYGAGMRLYAGAAELLAQLDERRVPLALVSNGPNDMQRAALANLGVERHFRAVLISGDPDVARRKPDPRIFDLACTALETTPQQTVMVGDDPDSDIAGARAVGMDAYLVRGRKSGHDETATVADLAELLEVLRERVEPSGP
jgi:HAD superfamily hydrolase (TIGR01549 family)